MLSMSCVLCVQSTSVRFFLSSLGAEGSKQRHALTPLYDPLSYQCVWPLSSLGTIGHVAHGKSTVVKAISGVLTVRFKNELERNITIKLGYANAKVRSSLASSSPPHNEEEGESIFRHWDPLVVSGSGEGKGGAATVVCGVERATRCRCPRGGGERAHVMPLSFIRPSP